MGEMNTRSNCKVDRVIDRYGLEDPRHDRIEDGLLSRWHGTDGHREHGYRTLTEWFNKRLLRQAYESAGREVVGNRLEADYEALTSDEKLVREEVTADVRADGIDIDGLLSDMVSWGTMRTHLTDCLGGEKESGESDTDWERETMEMARSFAAEKAAEALSSLAGKGDVSGAESATVDVEFTLRCGECLTVIPADIAIQRGYVCEDHDDTQASPDQKERGDDDRDSDDAETVATVDTTDEQ